MLIRLGNFYWANVIISWTLSLLSRLSFAIVIVEIGYVIVPRNQPIATVDLRVNMSLACKNKKATAACEAQNACEVL
jgi:hypothetical protein